MNKKLLFEKYWKSTGISHHVPAFDLALKEIAEKSFYAGRKSKERYYGHELIIDVIHADKIIYKCSKCGVVVTAFVGSVGDPRDLGPCKEG